MNWNIYTSILPCRRGLEYADCIVFGGVLSFSKGSSLHILKPRLQDSLLFKLKLSREKKSSWNHTGQRFMLFPHTYLILDHDAVFFMYPCCIIMVSIIVILQIQAVRTSFFLTSVLGDTRRETQIIKAYANHTILPPTIHARLPSRHEL